MSKLVMIALWMGLSACRTGFGIDDNGQSSAHTVTDAWESAVSQASIGIMGSVAKTAP